MNREQIEDLVVESTGRSDKRTLIRSAIDMALGEISTRRLWSDLLVEGEVSISAGDESVDLANDTARIIEIRLMDDSQSRPMCIRPKKWLMDRCPDPSSTSQRRPYYGYLQGTTLYFVPFPDNTYTVKYTYCRLHPALSAATDPVLIRGADRAVQAWATYWIFKSIEKHEDAKEWLSAYEMQLRAAERLDKDNPVVKHVADQHQAPNVVWDSYWLDPFAQGMP